MLRDACPWSTKGAIPFLVPLFLRVKFDDGDGEGSGEDYVMGTLMRPPFPKVHRKRRYIIREGTPASRLSKHGICRKASKLIAFVA